LILLAFLEIFFRKYQSREKNLKVMLIVSACLAGIKCSYKREAKLCSKVIDLIKSGQAIPICPEQLGGLSTPREPAEQKGDKIVTISGKDVTDQFIDGANECLRIARLFACKKAILKARSPSCGVGKIYDGTFTRKLILGDGVLAKLLKANGVEVLSEEEL